jgi:signal transduction histidine kinase
MTRISPRPGLGRAAIAAGRTLTGSLRLRLLTIMLLTLVLALWGAQAWLGGLFRDHVARQFVAALEVQLNQLTARFEFDLQGRPVIDSSGLADPRWQQPYSGLYWQVDGGDAAGFTQMGVLRSRSLWDGQLSLAADDVHDGMPLTHTSVGPRGESVLALKRSIQSSDFPDQRWRLMVAADTSTLTQATDEFDSVLGASLAALGLLLTIAGCAQVVMGLSPLQSLRQQLLRVRAGRATRLQGVFPTEVMPLVDAFNAVLDRNAEVVTRARTQAGNLAHALKTPLAVLSSGAQQADADELRRLVHEQVQLAQIQIDRHLARARAAGAQHLPGQRTALQPVLEALLRVMAKVHADRGLEIRQQVQPDDLAFAGESQDLQEMLGNLLDNACRCARSCVGVHATQDSSGLYVEVDDDGPGIAPDQREMVLLRGVRLDESKPGSGLGLAIVLELAQLYGGGLVLETSPSGGLRARLRLPAAP